MSRSIRCWTRRENVVSEPGTIQGRHRVGPSPAGRLPTRPKRAFRSFHGERAVRHAREGSRRPLSSTVNRGHRGNVEQVRRGESSDIAPPNCQRTMMLQSPRPWTARWCGPAMSATQEIKLDGKDGRWTYRREVPDQGSLNGRTAAIGGIFIDISDRKEGRAGRCRRARARFPQLHGERPRSSWWVKDLDGPLPDGQPRSKRRFGAGRPGNCSGAAPPTSPTAPASRPSRRWIARSSRPAAAWRARSIFPRLGGGLGLCGEIPDQGCGLASLLPSAASCSTSPIRNIAEQELIRAKEPGGKSPIEPRVSFPRQHEPRAADAAQRHYRILGYHLRSAVRPGRLAQVTSNTAA